jgi:hypothetical protein
MWINQPFNVFLRVSARGISIKLGITASVKNGVLSVVRCPFGHIEKTLDSLDRPKDQNHALSRINFLPDA